MNIFLSLPYPLFFKKIKETACGKIYWLKLILCLLLFSSFDIPDPLQELIEKGISIDLKDPVYFKGVLTTENGGVVSGPNIRIQAENITCQIKPQLTIKASSCLLVEYGNFAFVGEELYFDFETNTGYILCGRLGVEPYFIYSKRIELLADGTYSFENLFLTTTEDVDPDWALIADSATLSCDRYLRAQRVQFRLLDIPVFWLPWINADLKAIIESPIKYRIRWGGEQGWRLGLIYELFSTETFNLYLRFDYRLNRGPGGGIESDYISRDKRIFLFTKNYLARDNSIEDLNERFRYRFQGIYGYNSSSGATTIDLSYDKLSDKEMATDYAEKELELKTGRRTAFNLRHEENWAITNLYSRVKINSFETVKQELPTISTTFYPASLFQNLVKFQNCFKIGYLSYNYTDDLVDVRNYNSARAIWLPKLYTTRQYSIFSITPSIGGTGILYSKTPVENDKILVTGSLECDINTTLTRNYKFCNFILKHTIVPYAHYTFYTYPTINPNQHYIFGIEDGISHLNMLRTGMRHLFYQIGARDPFRILTLDFYTYLFFDTPTIGAVMPKLYVDFIWDITPRLRNVVSSAWDLEHGDLEHINYRIDWTISSTFALAVEYRQRSRYAFRKSDYSNFFLDSFRPIEQLVRSPVSDRRDTLLFHTYYRFLPNWAVNFYLRHGWHRKTEPNYTEYEVDLLTTIRSIWHAKITYQKREDDHRIALFFYLALDRPLPCAPLL